MASTDPNLRKLVRKIAEEEGINPDLAEALVQTESSFRPWVVSKAGAIGLAQVTPRAARDIDPKIKREDLFDPETNLRTGFRYLNKLKKDFGDLNLAISAYNMGPARVRSRLKRGLEPDYGYRQKVFSHLPQQELPDLNLQKDLQEAFLRLVMPSEGLGAIIQQLEGADAR